MDPYRGLNRFEGNSTKSMKELEKNDMFHHESFMLVLSPQEDIITSILLWKTDFSILSTCTKIPINLTATAGGPILKQ